MKRQLFHLQTKATSQDSFLTSRHSLIALMRTRLHFLPYRTLVTADGAGNILEVGMTLSDYSARSGGDAKDVFSTFTLSEDENHQMQRLIQSFSKKRRSGNNSSVPLENIEAAMDLDQDGGEIDLNSSQTGLPLPNAEAIKAPIVQEKEELPSPWKPMGNFKRRSMTHIIFDFRELEDPDTQKIECQWGCGAKKCHASAKKRQIFCGHHLLVASRKFQAKKERRRMKRSRTEDSSSSDADPDYSSLIQEDESAVKKVSYGVQELSLEQAMDNPFLMGTAFPWSSQ
jgi:hypothetical protein